MLSPHPSAALAVLAALGICPFGALGAAAPQFWYEDNNMRRAGGYPPDFREMFTQPDQWKELRGLIDVYYIRGNTLNNVLKDFGADFVRDHFVKVLRDDGITIAIDNPIGAETAVPLLRSFGATVGYVTLQSTISKCKPDEVPQRVERAIREIVRLHKAIPDVKVGLIDATPTKGREYREPYRRLVDGVAAAGARLDYIQLDCPADQATRGPRISWEKVKEVERFVQDDLGIDFGFICVSAAGGQASDQAFYDHVMDIPNRYIRGDSQPDQFILMSWFPHPSRALPENAPDGQYPMTKVGLHLARRLREWAAAPVTPR